MKHAVYKNLSVLLILLYSLVAFTASSALGGPVNKNKGKETVSQPSDRFTVLWKERRQLVKAGNYSEAESKVEEMILERLGRGISNLYVYSVALIKESRQLAADDNKKQAYLLIEQARNLAPDYYGTYAVQWRYQLSDGRILSALVTAVRGWRKKHSAFHTAYPSIYNMTAIALMVYFCLILLFAGFLLVKYLKLAAHDFQERIPGLDKRSAMIMTAAMALFPAAFIPNLIIYSFVLILLLWIYMSNRQRIPAAVMVVMLFFLPLLLNVMGSGFAADFEPVFRSVVQVREGVWNAKNVRILDQAGKKETSATRENIILSLVKTYTYTGRHVEALALLDELESDGGDLSAFISLQKGNIYYSWGKYREALGWYEKTVSQLPDSSIAHYNLAMVLSRSEIMSASADSVNRSEQEIERVRELDPHTFERWNYYQGLNPEIFVLDMPLPLDRIWAELWVPTPSRIKMKDDIFSFLSGGVSLKVTMVFAAIVLLLMGVLTFIEKLIPHAIECTMCGIPICMECKPADSKEDTCSRCLTVFGSKTGLDPRTRERARAEVRLAQDRAILTAEILSVLLPGSGHLLLGKSVRGVLFALGSLTFVSILVFRHGVLRSEWFVPGLSSFFIIFLIGILYIAYVGLSVWSVSSRE